MGRLPACTIPVRYCVFLYALPIVTKQHKSEGFGGQAV